MADAERFPDAAPSVSLADQIASVEREVRMRQHVYPRRVADGRMSAGLALTETTRMEAVLRTLTFLRDQGEPT